MAAGAAAAAAEGVLEEEEDAEEEGEEGWAEDEVAEAGGPEDRCGAAMGLSSAVAERLGTVHGSSFGCCCGWVTQSAGAAAAPLRIVIAHANVRELNAPPFRTCPCAAAGSPPSASGACSGVLSGGYGCS